MLLVVLEEDMAALKARILVHPLAHHPLHTSTRRARVAVVAESKKLSKCGHKKSI